MSLARIVLADDPTLDNVQRSEQGCGAMPVVIRGVGDSDRA